MLSAAGWSDEWRIDEMTETTVATMWQLATHQRCLLCSDRVASIIAPSISSLVMAEQAAMRSSWMMNILVFWWPMSLT
jgi:hypothetical protein